ncbi:MAG: sensor histidine kinase [Clostridia bacterium]|nr:sensor histidine kinase [Clostridia bacterium]
MKLFDFLKQKIITIFLISFALATIEIFLLVYDIPMLFRLYIPISILIVYFVGIMIEYLRKKYFYNAVLNHLNELDKKFLLAEVIDDSNFIEGKILKSVLEETDKSMLEHVNIYKRLQEDYKDYIELWIHEIKLPIATSKMIIENNKSEVTKSIDEELDKIDNYTEQALFYARSNTVEKDYAIKKNSLEEIVDLAIKKNKNILISNRVKIELNHLDHIVYTDSKWCSFILSQIIQNSVKYSKGDEKTIQFYSRENKDNVILYIEDKGIGIKESEIVRVFDKGFTGSNGRVSDKKSTGIGLYLCKKLCEKLGLAIHISSEYNKYTIVEIVFPKGSYTQM